MPQFSTHARQRRTPPWKRRRRRLMLILSVPLMLLVALLAYRTHLRARANESLAALEAMGIPLSEEAFAAWHPYQKGENAATQYLEAASRISPLDPARAASLPYFSESAEYRRDQPYPDAMLSAARDVLAENAAVFEILDQAAAVKESHYGIDYNAGIGVSMASLQRLDPLSKLLALDALVAAETGRVADAAEALAGMLRLGASLRNEPAAYPQYRRHAVNSLFCVTLERVLGRASLAEAQLRTLECAISEAEAPEAFHRSLVGEIRSQIRMLSRAETLAVSGPLANLLALIGVTDGALRTFADTAASQIELTRGDFQQAFTAAQRIDAWVEHAGWFQRHLNVYYWGVGSRAHYHFLDLGRLRAARAAVGVARYQAAHGALPSSVEALAAFLGEAMPSDPFSGETVRYTREDTGYVVYCVGRFPETVEERLEDGERSARRQGEVPFVRVVTGGTLP